MPSDTRSPAPDRLATEPEALLEQLDDPDFIPALATIAAVRDRAAAHLMSEPSLAYALSQRLLRLAQRHSGALGEEGLAVAWRCRAEACLFSGRLRLARRAYERACTAAETARAHGLLGQILVGRIHLLSLLGEAGQAENLGLRAERLLRRAGDLPYLGKLQMNRGNALYQRDRYAEALAAYAKAAGSFARLGQRDATWVGLLMNQAIACTNLSLVERSRRLFLQTERECTRLGLDSLLAHARFNRAFLEALRGDYRTALALLEEAGQAFADQAQPDMLAASQRSRAEIYLDLGLADEAKQLTQLAVDGFTREDMALDAALARLDDARCLIALGRSAEAEAPLAAALAHYRQRRLRPRIAQVLQIQALVARDLGDLAGASRLAARARRLYTSLALHIGERESSFLLAEIALARNRPAAAVAALRDVAARARSLGTGEQVRLQGLLGQASGRRGDSAGAARHLDLALAALEAQRRLIPGAELRTRAFDRHSALYGERIALHLAAAAPRFAAIFQLAERARARGFRERAASRPVPLPAGQREARAALASLTRRIEDSELLGSDAAGTLDRLRREALALERRILSESRRREGLSAAGSAWQRTAPPGRIAALLAPQECLLQYFVAADRVIALVIDAGHQRHVVLPARADALRALAADFRFQLDAAALAAGSPGLGADFLRAGMERALVALHTALIAPLQGILPAGGRLTLVPHDFLHGVPFECLHDGEAYLGDRILIARAPTADFLLARERRRRQAPGGIHIAGAVRVGPPEVRAEIEAIAARFAEAGLPAELHVDPTRSALLSIMPTCRLLHLSTHGRFRADNPHFSRLATDDGAVFLADVAGQDLAAELIVLSACESGEVLGERGDELAGVAHGFIAAGARHLVASRWRVHDAATREFMDAFYRCYLAEAKGDPPQAVREAARAVRAQRPHPFYWGGFSSYGA